MLSRRPDLFLAQLELSLGIDRRSLPQNVDSPIQYAFHGMWFVLDQFKFEIFDLMSSTLKQVSTTATIANAANPISNMKRSIVPFPGCCLR